MICAANVLNFPRPLKSLFSNCLSERVKTIASVKPGQRNGERSSDECLTKSCQSAEKESQELIGIAQSTNYVYAYPVALRLATKIILRNVPSAKGNFSRKLSHRNRITKLIVSLLCDIQTLFSL
jgi:hypothetical protein